MDPLEPRPVSGAVVFASARIFTAISSPCTSLKLARTGWPSASSSKDASRPSSSTVVCGTTDSVFVTPCSVSMETASGDRTVMRPTTISSDA